MFRQGMQTALHLLYPPDCLACGGMVDTENALCGACWRDAHFLTGALCDSCAEPLPGDAGSAAVYCDTCLSTARGWRHGRAAFRYTGTGRLMVLGLKHADRLDLADPCGQWLSKAVDFALTDTLIVPVPLHWSRMVLRRYNQSALLAQSLAKSRGLTCLPDALVRKRITPKLDGKTREERFDLLRGAIAAHPQRGNELKNRHVLLVDDVMTSGATLSACTEACFEAGAKNVDVAVLARVARET